MSTNDHEDLSHALEVLADRQLPPGSAPTADLLRRGRRSKRLRAATVTGTAVAVGALAMGTLFIGGPGATTTGIGPAAAAASGPEASSKPSSTPSGSSKPSGEPSTKPSGSAKPSGTPSEVSKPSGTPSTKTSNSPVLDPRVKELLTARIPAGYRIANSYDDPDPAPGSGVRYRVATTMLLVDDAKSPVEGTDIRLEISHMPGMAPGTTYQPNPTCDGASNCTVTQRPDGSVLMVKLPPAAGDFYRWSAALYRTDGNIVTASANNSPMMGGPIVQPAFNGDQLTTLVLDPVWSNVIDQLKAQFG
ncbi:hypothetical protein ACIHEI_06620 [Kitasatospora sp. NPDC051984]|uniref:hypothetical protein n=1 Tax=Kitasatospora sp. NPDC051984 TaxID=3364059 RepID=UPI0037C7A528